MADTLELCTHTARGTGSALFEQSDHNRLAHISLIMSESAFSKLERVVEIERERERHG